MGRYLERVENTARLVASYEELLLDLPQDAGLDWSLALKILGDEAAYRENGGGDDELTFLLASPDNLASLRAAIAYARENARTSRDLLPSESWQAINELHLATRDLALSGARLTDDIVARCHEISGILEGTMSHGQAYQFLRLGRSLERADMTTRMIDVAAAILMSEGEELVHYRNGIWRAVLRALSGFQAYRQTMRRAIIAEHVMRFLLLDPCFPRSVLHCVNVLDAAARALPGGEDARAEVARLAASLERVDPSSLSYASVHEYVDEFQVELGDLHGVISETWLNPLAIG